MVAYRNTMITNRRSVRRETLRQKWQRIVRRVVWQMDIHPTARIASTANIDRTWPKGIHIGAGCLIDHYAIILTHDTTRGLYLDTYVGDGTVIGARAIVLPGVKIGQQCRIEAGAVIVRDIPDRCVANGNPAIVEHRHDTA